MSFFKSTEIVHPDAEGFVERVTPKKPDETIFFDSLPVKICVSCKRAYVWINEQMYDVSDQVDVEAWAKTERELQNMTGPGGDC